ncbi:PHD finger protein 3 isoform X1 [Silurus meridionalis]|nr:PHD finger protein 3 isoform X1 [Silurus meridionalis]
MQPMRNLSLLDPNTFLGMSPSVPPNDFRAVLAVEAFMDIVGTFNHLIPSDQLEDSLLLGQTLECEASDEFPSGQSLPEDSLKNMLSDKDPMFGSASPQFHLLENDDANFQLSSSLDHDMKASGFSESADGDETPAKFPRGRRKGTTQLQRKQTALSSRGRGRGGQMRRSGPFRGVSTEARVSGAKNEEEPGAGNISAEEKRDDLLSRRFNVHKVHVDPSMNPVVVLRRLTVTVGGYKIELLPGPSHISGSSGTGAPQSLSFPEDSLTSESNGFNLEQAQALDAQPAPEIVKELNVIEKEANETPMDLGPYVNPNEVQHTNGEEEVSTDAKAADQNDPEKPSDCKTEETNVKQEKTVAKKLLKPKQPLDISKNKQLSKAGVLHKGSKLHKPQEKKVLKSAAENQPDAQGKPALSLKPKQATKPQKEQACDPAKHVVSPASLHSPTIHRKPSSDSSPGAKAVTNKSPSSVKKPHNPSPSGIKQSQSGKEGAAEEEPEKTKLKKPEKILQRQRSRSSRSVSIDEPELFIPDNAPVVKKGSGEGEPTPAPDTESAWDSSKQCGLCNKPHSNRFMVGCGRCDDWFHGDCIGLDLAKVQQMEKDDQEFVCLKCCADEGGKGNSENADTNSPADQKPAPDASVTAGGIRPFRKDSGERRSSVDSAQKTGSSVKVKKAKISLPSLKKPSTGQIRRSVRDSLEEILLKRLKESDLKISKEKPAELARGTEKELFALFQGVDSKYKNKYRSLMFNLRDTKNNVLFKRVLKGEIPPRDLVRMSAEELASKELAAWRQRENRHTIEMIEKEQREAERRPVTKITHKGEIEIENQEPAKAPEALPDPVPKAVEVSEEKKPESKAESPKKAKDTTSLHKSHLFDLNCKICTGRMAPPVEEATTKAVKVATTVVRRQSTVPEGESHEPTPTPPPIAASALVDDLSLRAMEEGLLNFPAYESRLESASSKEDTVAFLAGLETLWNGYIDMPSVARYLTKAYSVSGTLDHLTEDLPDTIQVGGRISPQTVWDYVEKIRASGTKEICVIRFTPDTEEDEISYTLLYAYFSSRRRYGVVANNRRQVKDMYLIPLGSTEKIPHQIVPFDGPGLETNRPNLLLGLIIRQRPKRDFVVLLPNEVSEPPSFLLETKPQVDSTPKPVVVRDEEREFISSLGRIQKKESANPGKSAGTESRLDAEDEENVSLRFLPGVLTRPKSDKATSDDEAKNATGSAVSQTSSSDGQTSGHGTPKTPTTPRLDRFIIKKKDPKPGEIKQEPSGSSVELTTSPGKEKEGGVVLSLKDKPGDVSTETFLSSLSSVQQTAEPDSTETKGNTPPPSTQSSQDPNLSIEPAPGPLTESTNDTTEDVSKHKTEDITTPGILQKTDVSEPVNTKPSSATQDLPQPKVAQSTRPDQSSVSQCAPSRQPSAPESAQPQSEFKVVEDIQTITTISLSGKCEGVKQSRRLLNPPTFASHGPPPAPFPPYHTTPVDHAYHPGPVPTYPPPSNPAPFIPPPFSYPPPLPPPMLFPHNDPPNPMHVPPWVPAVPPPACFPQAIPEAVGGPPQPYTTPRFPDSAMLNMPPLNKGDQGSELWDRKSRPLEEPFKKDDRDHYGGRYKHKSQHYERERHKPRSRSRSRSKSRSRSRSRHRHKSKHSHGERRKERHHSGHHRDRDKQRRDSDHEKHSRDRHS